MENLESIKKHFDIIDFIGKYITLKKTGRSFKANCPFHGEKTPSFVVSPERQIWHCFGACNEGGDIFKFFMKWEHVSFPEAVMTLAKEAGVSVDLAGQTDHTWKEKETLYAINSLAADFYNFLYEKHALGEKARTYVHERTVNDKIAHLFGVGYSPNSWNALLKFLQKKGYASEIVHTAGLAIKTDKGKFYDRFRGRLMFPLRDMRGNVIGFSGRQLHKNANEAKYINTPETPLYHKREHLFGIDIAKTAIKDTNEIIVMEGEFDVILSHQNGYGQTVAIKGSAFTTEHFKLIRRLTNKIILCLDMDTAGHAAVKRTIEEAEKYEFHLQVMQISGNKDPADTFKTAPHEFKNAYKNKLSVYDFLIADIAIQHDITDIYGKKNAVEELLPYIEHIRNPIVRDHYLKTLAAKVELPLESVQNALYSFRRKQRARVETKPLLQPTTPSRTRQEALEEYLISLLLQTPEQQHIFSSLARLTDEDYHLKATATLISLTKKAYQDNPHNFIDGLEHTLPNELKDYFNKCVLFELDAQSNKRTEAEKTILELKKISLKKQIKQSLASDSDEKTSAKVHELKQVEKSLST